jgi:uncharacterized protein (TIGR02996 family)
MPAETADEEGLLGAIYANPADDLPRLVLADWLDENATRVPCPECAGRGGHTYTVRESRTQTREPGFHQCGHCSGTGTASDGRAERAELIRRQIDLDGVPKARHPDMRFKDWKAGADRCTALLDRWGTGWTGTDWPAVNHLSRPNALPAAYVTFRRGFPARVAAPLGRLLAVLPGVPWLPLVEGVTATDREPIRWSEDAGSSSFDGREWFSWLAAWRVAGDRPDDVPPEVFRRLAAAGARVSPNGRAVRYDSRELALAALSAAVLSAARQPA